MPKGGVSMKLMKGVLPHLRIGNSKCSPSVIAILILKDTISVIIVAV